MNPFFAWLIKSTVSITLFYLLYRLVLRNDNRHTLNRFLLIGILAFSTLIPFIQLPVNPEKPVAKPVIAIHEFFEPETIETQYTDIQVITEYNPVQSETKIKSEINWILMFYLAIISFLLIKLALSVIRLTQLLSKAERKGFRSFILSVVNRVIQPFSFLNHIVLSKTDYDHHSDFIIAHECEHIRRAHSVDLIVCEIFLLLHWFNPFMWLLRSDLKLIHEFEADEALLKKGIDAPKYQLLVLEKAVGERRFALANHFFQKPILKRLKMMNRKQKTRWSGAKLLLFLPLALLLLQAFDKPELKILPNPIVLPATETDSTKAWVEQWVRDNVAILENLYEKQGFPDKTTLPDNKLVFDNSGNKDAIAIGGFYDITDQNKHNWFIVLQNRKNELLVENQFARPEELIEKVKNFIEGKMPKGQVPDFEEKTLPIVGKVKISKGLINYMKDRDTDEESYSATFRSFAEAYLEVRKNVSKERFSMDYFELEPEKREVIDEMVPVKIFIGIPRSLKVSSYIYFEINKDGTVQFDRKKYAFEEFKTIFLKKYETGKAIHSKTGTKKSFEVVVNDLSTKGEDILNVEEFLKNNNIKNFRFVSKTGPPPPPPPPPVITPLKITLNQNGTVTFWDKVYSLEEFGKLFPEKYKSFSESNIKNGNKNPILVSVISSAPIKAEYLTELKNILKNSKVQNLNFKSENNLPPPPPPLPSIITPLKIKLNENGTITFWDKVYTMEEFGKIFPEKYKSLSESEIKKGYKDQIVVSVTTPSVATSQSFLALKEILRKANVKNVNFKSGPDEKSKEKTSVNVDEVDEKPIFPGGEKELNKFFKDNIVVPEQAKDHFVIEKVYISFTVTKTGKVSDAKIHRGVQPDLDNEALRVVNSLPDWQPGKMKGKAVDVEMIIPVHFFNSDKMQGKFKGDPEKHVFSKTENMPEFPGGLDAMQNYILKNIKYPKNAFQKGISGTVNVITTVRKNGKLTDINIWGGMDPSLEEEALRVVSNMPDWIPGTYNGKPVDVEARFTIDFSRAFSRALGISVNTSKENTIVHIDNVDEKPQFPGGEKELSKFIKDNIIYPERAKNSISGKVYVSFTVTKTGKVSNAEIYRGVHVDLDNEALRVVSSMPDWKPGKSNGKAVDVTMTVPVYFNYIDLEDETFKGDPDKHIFSKITNMPEFPGGWYAMQSFVFKNIDYPKHISGKYITGTVYVKAIIRRNGKITDAKIHKSDNPLLDNEALRLVSLMPDWKPGLFNGKPVDTYSVFPIYFSRTSSTSKAISFSKTSKEDAGKLVLVNGNEFNGSLGLIPPETIDKREDINPPYKKNSLYYNNPKAAKGVIEINLSSTINSDLKLRKFIADNIKYPKEGFENNYQGITKFWINTSASGQITTIYYDRPYGKEVLQIDEVVVIGYGGFAKTEKKPEFSEVLNDEVVRVLKKTPLITDNSLQNKLLEIKVNFILQNKTKT